MRTLLGTLVTVIAVTAVAPIANAETAAPSRAVCYESYDVDHYDDSNHDIIRLSARYDCETKVIGFEVTTRDSFSPASVALLAVSLDVDPSDPGCDGAEFVVTGLYEVRDDGSDEFVAKIISTPTCDEDAWVDLGTTDWAQTGSDSLRLDLDHGRVGSPSTFSVMAYLEGFTEDHGEGDHAPEAPLSIDLPKSTAPCTRCYHVTNELRGGGSPHEFVWGRPSDTVLVGDWDGDGDDNLGARRGQWYHLMSHLGAGKADTNIAYGRGSDDVIVGDWDGNGSDTLGVRRGNTFHLKNSLRGGTADNTFSYGKPNDVVYVGDWDGDGVDTLMVRRGRTFFQSNRLRGGNAETVFTYGRLGDELLIGDWDGNGTDTLGVRRRSTFYLTNAQRSGNASIVFEHGREDDLVYVGDWDGDGVDTLMLRR